MTLPDAIRMNAHNNILKRDINIFRKKQTIIKFVQIQVNLHVYILLDDMTQQENVIQSLSYCALKLADTILTQLCQSSPSTLTLCTGLFPI